MKKGKISESILRRSVFKYIKTKNNKVKQGAGVGLDCAFLSWEEKGELAVSTETAVLPVSEAGRLACIAAVNNLAAGGSKPIAVMLSIVLPLEEEEKKLQEIMKQTEDCCRELQIQIAGGHTEASDSVRNPIITVTAIGYQTKEEAGDGEAAGKLQGQEQKQKQKQKQEQEQQKDQGLDLVMTKWIGLEGTVILAKEKEEELLTRYPLTLIKEAQGLKKHLLIAPEAATALRSGVQTMHDVRNGGIFGALWELSKRMGVGLSIDLKKIPVKQETIEICEFFQLNPYELLSGGSLLMLVKDGEEMVEKLEQEGIFSAVIGKTTEGNDKVIFNEEETRYLEPAKPDEIYKINFKAERKDESK